MYCFLSYIFNSLSLMKNKFLIEYFLSKKFRQPGYKNLLMFFYDFTATVYELIDDSFSK
jgi:hypothetical protein